MSIITQKGIIPSPPSGVPPGPPADGGEDGGDDPHLKKEAAVLEELKKDAKINSSEGDLADKVSWYARRVRDYLPTKVPTYLPTEYDLNVGICV